MSVMQCKTCGEFIDTDMDDFDFENEQCLECVMPKGMEGIDE